MRNFRKSSVSHHEFYEDKHRFEHWYRDNTVYFITPRCRDRYPAFQSDEAKAVFWDRFTHYTQRNEKRSRRAFPNASRPDPERSL